MRACFSHTLLQVISTSVAPHAREQSLERDINGRRGEFYTDTRLNVNQLRIWIYAPGRLSHIK